MSLAVKLFHRYRNFTLDVAFEAATPGIIALFGPSGCGKTSILSAMAGVLPEASLTLRLNGTVLHDVPPELRRIGTVFQEGRLFPHLRVRDNLLYGMRRAAKNAERRFASWDGVIDLLGIGHLLARWPRTLSGGERQRVAIGRALLSQPRLLLMDEPLSALDAARREEILPYLARLPGAFGLPVVYASHALDEVTRLADTLVLIESGRTIASGALPALAVALQLPLAQRDDAAGVLIGHVHAHAPERGLSAIACGIDLLWVTLMEAPPGTPARLRIAARDVILAAGKPVAASVTNMLTAVISDISTVDGGASGLVQLDLKGGGMLLARVTADAVRRLALTRGMEILALIKAVSIEAQT